MTDGNETILVIGYGGREHVLADWAKASPRVKRVIYTDTKGLDYTPNAAMQKFAEFFPTNSLEGAVELAQREKVDLTIFGPEDPLCKGGVDMFSAAGLDAFGPSKKAAELEGSKVFSKRFMEVHGIPTAGFRVFSDPDLATAYIIKANRPLVVKADGLAAGKGAIVCPTLDEQIAAVNLIMREREFKDAGNQIVIEEMLKGQECSVLVFADGRNAVLLPTSQDHKPAYDGDKGPNTGGMGAYCPAPVATPAVLEQIAREIITPTLKGMADMGRPYKGVLYVGTMIDEGKAGVLEYNVRFGDPEAQPLRQGTSKKVDIVEVMHRCVDGTLREYDVEGMVEGECYRMLPSVGSAVCVVAASEGYPGKYEKGKVITGLDEAEADFDVTVYHAGTKMKGDDVVTDGGRVLGVTAVGDTLEKAKRKADIAMSEIEFGGKPPQYRTDIAAKGITMLKD